MEKVAWSGRIVAVQPHIRLMRSFEQRHHSYQGREGILVEGLMMRGWILYFSHCRFRGEAPFLNMLGDFIACMI